MEFLKQFKYFIIDLYSFSFGFFWIIFFFLMMMLIIISWFFCFMSFFSVFIMGPLDDIFLCNLAKRFLWERFYEKRESLGSFTLQEFLDGNLKKINNFSFSVAIYNQFLREFVDEFQVLRFFNLYYTFVIIRHYFFRFNFFFAYSVRSIKCLLKDLIYYFYSYIYDLVLLFFFKVNQNFLCIFFYKLFWVIYSSIKWFFVYLVNAEHIFNFFALFINSIRRKYNPNHGTTEFVSADVNAFQKMLRDLFMGKNVPDLVDTFFKKEEKDDVLNENKEKEKKKTNESAVDPLIENMSESLARSALPDFEYFAELDSSSWYSSFFTYFISIGRFFLKFFSFIRPLNFCVQPIRNSKCNFNICNLFFLLLLQLLYYFYLYLWSFIDNLLCPLVPRLYLLYECHTIIMSTLTRAIIFLEYEKFSFIFIVIFKCVIYFFLYIYIFFKILFYEVYVQNKTFFDFLKKCLVFLFNAFKNCFFIIFIIVDLSLQSVLYLLSFFFLFKLFCRYSKLFFVYCSKLFFSFFAFKLLVFFLLLSFLWGVSLYNMFFMSLLYVTSFFDGLMCDILWNIRIVYSFHNHRTWRSTFELIVAHMPFPQYMRYTPFSTVFHEGHQHNFWWRPTTRIFGRELPYFVKWLLDHNVDENSLQFYGYEALYLFKSRIIGFLFICCNMLRYFSFIHEFWLLEYFIYSLNIFRNGWKNGYLHGIEPFVDILYIFIFWIFYSVFMFNIAKFYLFSIDFSVYHTFFSCIYFCILIIKDTFFYLLADIFFLKSCFIEYTISLLKILHFYGVYDSFNQIVNWFVSWIIYYFYLFISFIDRFFLDYNISRYLLLDNAHYITNNSTHYIRLVFVRTTKDISTYSAYIVNSVGVLQRLVDFKFFFYFIEHFNYFFSYRYRFNHDFTVVFGFYWFFIFLIFFLFFYHFPVFGSVFFYRNPYSFMNHEAIWRKLRQGKDKEFNDFFINKLSERKLFVYALAKAFDRQRGSLENKIKEFVIFNKKPSCDFYRDNDIISYSDLLYSDMNKDFRTVLKYDFLRLCVIHAFTRYSNNPVVWALSNYFIDTDDFELFGFNRSNNYDDVEQRNEERLFFKSIRSIFEKLDLLFFNRLPKWCYHNEVFIYDYHVSIGEADTWNFVVSPAVENLIDFCNTSITNESTKTKIKEYSVWYNLLKGLLINLRDPSREYESFWKGLNNEDLEKLPTYINDSNVYFNHLISAKKVYISEIRNPFADSLCFFDNAFCFYAMALLLFNYYSRVDYHFWIISYYREYSWWSIYFHEVMYLFNNLIHNFDFFFRFYLSLDSSLYFGPGGGPNFRMDTEGRTFGVGPTARINGWRNYIYFKIRLGDYMEWWTRYGYQNDWYIWNHFSDCFTSYIFTGCQKIRIFNFFYFFFTIFSGFLFYFICGSIFLKDIAPRVTNFYALNDFMRYYTLKNELRKALIWFWR